MDRYTKFTVAPYAGLEDEKIFKRYGEEICDLKSTEKWDIPDKVMINVAITGAFASRKQNPYVPISPEEIYRESENCIEAGARVLHMHVREPNGLPSGDMNLYRKVIEPLKKTYGDEILIGGCAQFGRTFAEKIGPVIEGLFEISAVNPTVTHIAGTVIGNTPKFIQLQAKAYQECGCKTEIALYDTGDLTNAKTWLIDTGILERPSPWIVLPAIPGCADMPNPLSMVELMAFFYRRIKEVDPRGTITICAAGRASSYLAVLGLTMGLHLRIGMEDTIFKWPHSDEVIDSNAKLFRSISTIAKEMGRQVATADESREILGIKKKGGHSSVALKENPR
jgi:3-keto-5-aminohexanoate cleavage enzyme